MPYLVKATEKVSEKVRVEGDNPLKKHKNYVKHTLEEWAERYKNYSWKEIATEAGWKDLQPLGPKFEWRYIENPIDGNIMDMRHVVVVGYMAMEKRLEME